jgi:hypothetical protein
MSTTSKLSHLFRALKAPAAARALTKLAERARVEDWCYERFAEALLSAELSSPPAPGLRATSMAAAAKALDMEATIAPSSHQQSRCHPDGAASQLTALALGFT